MAMTDEELLLQMNILASKTDESTNPNMVYKTNKTLNKGLNPDYFSGNSTKIVNALNELFEKDNSVSELAVNVGRVLNNIITDVTSTEGAAKWAELQEKMGQPTIMDGLIDIYSGAKGAQILGVTSDDVDKVLSVSTNDSGELVIKAIEQIANGGSVGEVAAEAVAYSNEDVSSVTNVQEALDYVIEVVRNSESSGGGVVNWEDVMGKPEVIVDSMALSEDYLELKDGDTVVSSIPLMTEEDVEDLIEQLN